MAKFVRDSDGDTNGWALFQLHYRKMLPDTRPTCPTRTMNILSTCPQLKNLIQLQLPRAPNHPFTSGRKTGYSTNFCTTANSQQGLSCHLWRELAQFSSYPEELSEQIFQELDAVFITCKIQFMFLFSAITAPNGGSCRLPK